MFPRVTASIGQQQGNLAPKITGMLVDLQVLTVDEIISLLQDQSKLNKRIEYAKETLNT